MKKTAILFLGLITTVLCVSAAEPTYNIIYDNDTIIKTRVGSFSLASRSVRRII